MFNFLQHFTNAITGGRMSREGPGYCSRILVLNQIEPLEKGDQCSRIVTGLVSVFDTQIVSLSFVGSGEPHCAQRHYRFAGSASNIASKCNLGDGREVYNVNPS